MRRRNKRRKKKGTILLNGLGRLEGERKRPKMGVGFVCVFHSQSTAALGAINSVVRVR